MQQAFSTMASNSNFLVTSTSLPRQQDGDGNTAALGVKAQQLRESTNVSVFTVLSKRMVYVANQLQ